MEHQPTQPPTGVVEVPASLRRQLNDYRGRVWRLKLAEAAAIAVFGVAAAYLTLFASDRFVDTPAAARVLIGLAAVASCLVVPWFVHRWVWQRRTPKQLARLLSRRLPRVGDQLLGVLELAENRSEQSRSRVLVEAAIGQAAEDAARRDLNAATPPSRLQLWSWLAAACVFAAAMLAVFSPAAAGNAWRRLANPFGGAARYTFASIALPPAKLVVPHGEAFELPVSLAEDSAWRPTNARARIGRQEPITAPLGQAGYQIKAPPQIAPDLLRLRVGDARHTVRIEPALRPELTGLVARVMLPEHLERPEPQEQDARSGALTLTRGSRVAFTATAGRPLAAATVDGAPVSPQGAIIQTPEKVIDESRSCELAWIDENGLSGDEPFLVAISAADDEKPRVVIENLPNQQMVLESELATFVVRAADDYGVRRVGCEWRGAPRPGRAAVRGERVLADGGPTATGVAAEGAFSARSAGVEPQLIELRAFAEDYCPGNGRVYSAPRRLNVLSAEQHAVWIAERVSGWRKRAMETHDRETRLYEQNRALRLLPPAELDTPATRRRIARQAAAELANGRLLEQVRAAGAELVRAAARNPTIEAGSLELWAGVVLAFDGIASEQMPAVARLLSESAETQGGAVGENLGQAIGNQRALLTTFKTVIDSLGEAASYFRSGTIAVRLKLAAVRQEGIARAAGREIVGAFGRADERIPGATREAFRGLVDEQRENRLSVSRVADDLRALSGQYGGENYKFVLDEIDELRPLEGLRRIEEDLATKPGLAIAQSEFWADTLDRLAADLVTPPPSDNSNDDFESGGTARGVPPALVLEVMQIAEAEVDLREETRVAEQARVAVPAPTHLAEAERLSQAQDRLRERVAGVANRLRWLKFASSDFQQELQMLADVGRSMTASRNLLARGSTGARAIAAETQAIELMLKTEPNQRRQESGGGAGSSPGGGGKGDTDTAALALIGAGISENANRSSRVADHSTGGAGEPPPAEFRAGLDEYFSRLEQDSKDY